MFITLRNFQIPQSFKHSQHPPKACPHIFFPFPFFPFLLYLQHALTLYMRVRTFPNIPPFSFLSPSMTPLPIMPTHTYFTNENIHFYPVINPFLAFPFLFFSLLLDTQTYRLCLHPHPPHLHSPLMFSPLFPSRHSHTL